MPRLGCPQRCLYCHQEAQTGQPRTHLPQVLERLRALLKERQRLGCAPVELAFYGGTFTALPEPWPLRFLELAGTFRERGVLCRVRCSTRPDAVTAAQLAALKAAGLDLVELGIQSFAPQALAESGRGYAASQALEACRLVREAGLGLGIQLLPGLPGQLPGDFTEDVHRVAALKPDLVRLYPCLVLAGAPLAHIWKGGGYSPWSLEDTVRRLARALPVFWRAGVPVARLGVATEPGLVEQVLAGPQHPALGAMARGAALRTLVCQEIKIFRREFGVLPGALWVPRRYQGEFWGQGGVLRPCYARLGLGQGRVRFWDQPHCALQGSAP